MLIYFAHVHCHLFASTLHVLALSGYILARESIFRANLFRGYLQEVIENSPGGLVWRSQIEARARGSGLKPIIIHHRNVTLYVNCIALNEYSYVYVIKMWNDTIFGNDVQVCVYS